MFTMELFGREEKRLVTPELVTAETASSLSRRFSYELGGLYSRHCFKLSGKPPSPSQTLLHDLTIAFWQAR